MDDSSRSRLLVFNRCKQVEDPDVDGVGWEPLRDFHHGSRISAMAWSPETNLTSMPRVLRLCFAENDKKVRLISSDMKDDDQVQVLGEHRDYINCVSFQPDQGALVASASDDLTCQVWGLDGQQAACFTLTAPGMAVCWHPQEPGKVMVAEKKGIIRFYHVQTQQPIMSLDCSHIPLLSADWCLGNSLRVAAVAGTDWFIFDTSRSSRPLENEQAHDTGCRAVKWCQSQDYLLATTGGRPPQLKVFNIKANQLTLNTELEASGGLSWHFRLPIVAIGGDCKVHLWHTGNVRYVRGLG
ncbi:hypothetical protein CAPTEDRAFT_196279 [Capitella teleta]|uniref:Nucleoporin Nup37 n=1 Tax=Capitella teleta TaxID=283909 RepID=R7UNT3_CAPTE|nr:hypothetical protein CAPTEDRAFT_196279 [Capitella teleta]|eukprot:ELU08194.1 hypothetical protein CAPTEDRAFT_196279 [Capitella teleta]